jgi:hypothetical protein
MSIEERSWMYERWNDNGHHSEDWVHNTNDFLDHAFNIIPNAEKSGVPCPCLKCDNRVRWRRAAMTAHLCKRGFTPGYTRWIEHGEDIVSSSIPEDVSTTSDRLDEMLGELGDAMHIDSEEEEPTLDAKAFYAMLSASKEPLHNFTCVSQLTAVARLIEIKSQHKLSGECINSLLRLIGDVLPENHKMSNNLYE